jgi:prephenate dehydratase
VSFAEAFSAVQNNEVEYAVIPFENSTNGSVVQTLDLLADRQGLYSDVSVCGEHYLTVHHCLLACKSTALARNADNYQIITKLYTHPQAWGQCEAFLSTHFRGVERQDVSSTSKAAEIVSKDTSGHTAAIASRFAAEYHGAEVLETNIEDRADNTTRFLILRNLDTGQTNNVYLHLTSSVTGKKIPDNSSAKHKNLVSFIIEHSSPGALADALLIFKAHGMNLTSINSRPSLVCPWQYIFFVECEQVPSAFAPDSMERILEDLRKISKSCRNLGSWKDGLISSP